MGFGSCERVAMAEAIDFVAAQHAVNTVQQDDEAGQLAATVATTQHAPDDISYSYVSKEVSQAMSYSVTAEEMKSTADRIQSRTMTPAAVGAQDAHMLQANIRSKNHVEDELDETKDDLHAEATSSSQVKGETSGTPREEPGLDKFEFPVAPARPPSILKPRKPILQALTLPNEQSPQPSPRDSELGDSPRDSPGRTPHMYVAHAMMNKKPPKTLIRSKTRLQDPPPMTPAVSALVARGRLFANSPDQEYQPPVTSRGLPTSRKVSVVGNLSRVASFAVSTPGKLKSLAAGMFTPRGGAVSTPTGFPPPEEEIDPLDDESIPKYKKWKKRGSRWLHILQWICLVTVCVLLACSVRVRSMKTIYWYNIVLWQWFTLLLVVTSGRLISGWSVQV